jgi:hypothetical protein
MERLPICSLADKSSRAASAICRAHAVTSTCSYGEQKRQFSFSRAGCRSTYQVRFDARSKPRNEMPMRWPQLGLLPAGPQPDQCLSDCTIDVAGTRIGVRLKDGDALGEGGRERRLELRRSREKLSSAFGRVTAPAWRRRWHFVGVQGERSNRRRLETVRYHRQ